jgi:hypothetical protein
MRYTYTIRFLFAILVCAALTLVSCGEQATPLPVLTSTPTVTPTTTSTPAPTNTSTPVPTPVGGSGALLINARSWDRNLKKNTPYIYQYDLSIKTATLLLEGYYAHGVSLDGHEALVASYGEKSSLFLLSLDNGELTLLVNDYDVYSGAYYFEEIDWIAFGAMVDGTVQIFIIRPDGTELRQLTTSSTDVEQIYPIYSDGVIWVNKSHDFMRKTNIGNSETTTLPGGFWWHVFSEDGKYVLYNGPARPSVITFSSPIEMNGQTIQLSAPPALIDDPYYDSSIFSAEVQFILPEKLMLVGGQPPKTQREFSESVQTHYYVNSWNGNFIAELPHLHSPLKIDSIQQMQTSRDYWDLFKLSPDGGILLIRDLWYTETDSENIYYLLNLNTLELQEFDLLLPTELNQLENVFTDGDIFWIP